MCDNAARAIELAKSDSFDLIFSDVVMPAKDGLSLLEEMRSLGITTPVVMMSGQAHIEMAVRATKLGALDFLEKPISTDKLLLTVENVLKLQRLESENRQLRQRLGIPGEENTREARAEHGAHSRDVVHHQLAQRGDHLGPILGGPAPQGP